MSSPGDVTASEWMGVECLLRLETGTNRDGNNKQKCPTQAVGVCRTGMLTAGCGALSRAPGLVAEQ